MSEPNKDMKKTLVRVRHLELSRDFVLFMVAFGVLIAILLYSPAEIRNVLVEVKNAITEIQKLGQQNQDLASQGVNNTNKIINDSAMRFNVSGERNIALLTKLSSFINASETERKTSGVDVIKVLFLYMEDMERDINKLMTAQNISNSHFVSINGTHAITEQGVFKLPFDLGIKGNYKDLKISK